MHGVTIETGAMDWQVLQRDGGSAAVRFAGTWRLHPAAIEVGVAHACPAIRVMDEMDGFPIIPWTHADCETDADGHGGRWHAELIIPVGGPYRIETGLDTVSTQPGLAWMFRGDVRLHVCVGDVFVIAGQSNASGYAKDSGYDPPGMQVHHFRRGGHWDLACHPLNESTGAQDGPGVEMGVTGSSPYLSFGRRYAAQSRCPVGLISTAQGGQPITRWDDRAEGGLFRQMLARIEASGERPAGVLWYQGETDAMSDDAPAYADRFAHVVKSVRRSLGYEIPFFLFQLNRTLLPSGDEGWGMVREAQRRAMLEIPGVYALPAFDVGISDAIHNSAHGNIALGERLARLCGQVLAGGVPFAAPMIERACAEGMQLRLSFSGAVDTFTFPEADAALAGFDVVDDAGPIALAEMKADKGAPGTLILTLERTPGPGANVCFAWQANPTRTPPLDSVTNLPPLAFYRFPMEQI